MSDSGQVTDNQAESRFEIPVGGQRAELTYRRRANRLILIHAEVPAENEGHGIGGLLMAAATERAAREGLTIVPLCPFARSWLLRHADAAGRAGIDWGGTADDQQTR